MLKDGKQGILKPEGDVHAARTTENSDESNVRILKAPTAMMSTHCPSPPTINIHDRAYQGTDLYVSTTQVQSQILVQSKNSTKIRERGIMLRNNHYLGAHGANTRAWLEGKREGTGCPIHHADSTQVAASGNSPQGDIASSLIRRPRSISAVESGEQAVSTRIGQIVTGAAGFAIANRLGLTNT